MTRTTRFTIITMQTLIAAGWFTAVGCSSSNDPATTPATGGSSGSGGAAGTDSSGGSSGSATAGSGTGGATSGGSAGSGGSTGGSGGTGGSTGGSAGSAAAGSGGSATVYDGGGTGGSATGGSAGSGGASDGGSSALCGNTAAGMAIAKGVACTAADPQTCNKTCGPEGKGTKAETCTPTGYAEDKNCAFAAGDYSCYKVPTAIDAKCPATAPVSSTACDVPSCTVCNAGGATPSMGSYVDSTNMTKVGYCVCPEPKVPGGTRKWSCASTTAWPCPNQTGC